jgi:hypothetical protein
MYMTFLDDDNSSCLPTPAQAEAMLSKQQQYALAFQTTPKHAPRRKLFVHFVGPQRSPTFYVMSSLHSSTPFTSLDEMLTPEIRTQIYNLPRAKRNQHAHCT